MDFNWNDYCGRNLVVCLIIGLLTTAFVRGEEVSTYPTAICFVSVGISNKSLPSFLLTTKAEATASQKKWLKEQNSPKFVFIMLSFQELKLIGEMLKQSPSQTNRNDRPFGTYIASRWNNDVKSDYLLMPMEAREVFTRIGKLEIPKETRWILEETIRRLSNSHDAGGDKKN